MAEEEADMSQHLKSSAKREEEKNSSLIHELHVLNT